MDDMKEMLNSVNSTAELIEIKKRVFECEEGMEKIMRLFENKSKIDFDRTDDWGARGFSMQIWFDQLNIAAIDKMQDLRNLYVEFIKLRRRQKQLEVVYNSERRIGFDIKRDLRESL